MHSQPFSQIAFQLEAPPEPSYGHSKLKGRDMSEQQEDVTQGPAELGRYLSVYYEET